MLHSPDHVVLGATDARATVGFLARLGFHLAGREVLPRSAAETLYGLESETEQTVLVAPGSSRGFVRVVETPHPAPPAEPFERGPHALDLYTSEIRSSLKTAAAAGARTGPIAAYEIGQLSILEAKAVGPDGLAVVFIQIGRRRPSLLDREPGRLHSEVHSAVFAVRSVSEALPFWRERAGLGVLLDETVREAAVARFMELPRANAPIRIAVLADAEQQPLRLELLEFPEDPGPARPSWPLRAGLHAVAFTVPSLTAALGRLLPVPMSRVLDWRPLLHEGSRAVTGEAPGAVRFELWESRE